MSIIPSGGGLSLLLDASQEFLGRFVGRVLRDEATFESTLEDAPSQPGGTLQVGVYLGFDLVDD
jgi:hypothetical protein